MGGGTIETLYRESFGERMRNGRWNFAKGTINLFGQLDYGVRREIQWNLANPRRLGTRMCLEFGLVKCIMGFGLVRF